MIYLLGSGNFDDNTTKNRSERVVLRQYVRISFLLSYGRDILWTRVTILPPTEGRWLCIYPYKDLGVVMPRQLIYLLPYSPLFALNMLRNYSYFYFLV
jgi:hypothetical protein